jgi:hypothetical protein
MRTLLTRKAGAPGTKRLQREHGEDLVCVRYRYDTARRERLKTVELIVERVPWTPRAHDDGEEPVHVRLNEDEHLLRRELLLHRARWDEATDTWQTKRSVATALGLTRRILRPKSRSTGTRQARDPRTTRREHR